MNPIMACQDKLLRVLKDKGDSLLYQHQFEAAPVSISLAPEFSERHSPIIGFGLNNGGIGVIELMRSKPRVIWSMELSKNDPVSIVRACKLDKSKPVAKNKAKIKKESELDDLMEEAQSYDLIVARDNGRIEIYSYENDNAFPTLCFETKIKSTITGIDVGNVTMPNSKDIILSCYDGKILALVDQKKFKKQGIMG